MRRKFFLSLTILCLSLTSAQQGFAQDEAVEYEDDGYDESEELEEGETSELEDRIDQLQKDFEAYKIQKQIEDAERIQIQAKEDSRLRIYGSTFLPSLRVSHSSAHTPRHSVALRPSFC